MFKVACTTIVTFCGSEKSGSGSHKYHHEKVIRVTHSPTNPKRLSCRREVVLHTVLLPVLKLPQVHGYCECVHVKHKLDTHVVSTTIQLAVQSSDLLGSSIGTAKWICTHAVSSMCVSNF